MNLVYEDTGRHVRRGHIVTDFRGERARVVGWEPPAHPSSTGRIYVRGLRSRLGGIERSFFPSVYGCKFTEGDRS